MNDDNNEMKIELPSLKGQSKVADNPSSPVLSENTESAIVYSNNKEKSFASVNAPVEEKKEPTVSPTPVIEENKKTTIAPLSPVIEEHQEESINYGSNLETPKPEMNQTRLANNSENVYVSNSVANANTLNQETSLVDNTNLNSSQESSPVASEPYVVNSTPINEVEPTVAPISEPAMETPNSVIEPAPISNQSPVEPVVAPIPVTTPIDPVATSTPVMPPVEPVVNPTPVMEPIAENNINPISNVNPNIATENNMVNSNLGPVNNSQPINNMPTNGPTTNNTVVSSEPKVNKASKKATIIGTVIALIITALLLYWFIYNYCIID